MAHTDIRLKTSSIRQFESIASINRSEWDQLAGGNIFDSYGWLRTIEETHAIRVRRKYYMLYQEKRPVAAVPCYFQYPDHSAITMDNLIFGRFKKVALLLRMTVLPALISGGRGGLSENFLISRKLSPDIQHRIIEKLINRMEGKARGKKSALCFCGITKKGKELNEILKMNRYLSTKEMPHTYLDIEWHTFRDYRRYLKKIHPATEKTIRQEINRAKRAGLVVRRLENPASRQNRLHEIMDMHYFRLNGTHFPFYPHFFERLKHNLGDKASVYVAEKGEELLGVLIMLRSNDTIFFPMVGVDRARSGRERIFFNLVFNQPIRDAIETGIKRIYYGKLLYDVKIKRGCKIADNNLYIKARGPVHERALKVILRCHFWRMNQIIANIFSGKIV